jgi:Protein of unknown function (DUF3558)
MRHRLISYTLAASITLMVAGCSTSPVTGTPSAIPSGTQSASTLAPGTPNVAHPLDTSAFQKNPCSVLTSAQLTQFNIGAKGAADSSNPLGPSCNWYDGTGPSRMTLGVTFLTAGQGLDGIY